MQEVPLRSRLLETAARIAVVAGAFALASTVACRRSYPLGKLSVRVADASDTPVPGVAADLIRITPERNIYWRASRTNSSGIAVFGEKNGGVIEGDYLVHITLTPWQKFAPGEKNNRQLTIKKGDDTVVRFTVVPQRPLLEPPRPIR